MTLSTSVLHTPPPRASRRRGLFAEQPARPQIPASQAAAVVTLPWFEARVKDAYRTYAAARRELELRREDLAVVQDVAAGAYDDAGA